MISRITAISAVLLLTLFSFLPSTEVQAQEQDTFKLNEEQRAEFFTLHQQIVDGLQEEFPNDVKARKSQIPCKKTKRRKVNAGSAVAMPASLEGGCIQTCAFAAAWAVASCKATACASCPDGFTFCAWSEAYAFGYAHAFSCMALCKQGTVPGASCY